MGVRPPSNDDTDDPDIVAFGIATIDARLEDADLAFPATAEEIHEGLGGGEVPYDAKGRTIALETALERADRSEFETRQELLNDLHDVFETRRANAGGLLAQFRALLPV